MSIRDARLTLTCDTDDCDESIDCSMTERRGQDIGVWDEPDFRWQISRGWSIVSRNETYCPACTKKRARAAKRAANKAAREAQAS